MQTEQERAHTYHVIRTFTVAEDLGLALSHIHGHQCVAEALKAPVPFCAKKTRTESTKTTNVRTHLLHLSEIGQREKQHNKSARMFIRTFTVAEYLGLPLSNVHGHQCVAGVP